MSNSRLVEFLRFGSSIPGSYWGCCAVDIIQCFKSDPDEKASIELVDGDGGQPMYGMDGKIQFAGPTNKDIFLQRLRVGTFGNTDMPNHAFFAILTEWQLKDKFGKKWLAILKENGFEFFRTVSNSVYDGECLSPLSTRGKGGNPNHIFVLVRNIGSGNVSDPFTPPHEWTDLSSVVPEPWTQITDTKALAKEQHAKQTELWNKIGPAKFLNEEQVVAAGAPVILAGKRSRYPQEPKATRERKKTDLDPTLQNTFPTIAA